MPLQFHWPPEPRPSPAPSAEALGSVGRSGSKHPTTGSEDSEAWMWCLRPERDMCRSRPQSCDGSRVLLTVHSWPQDPEMSSFPHLNKKETSLSLPLA